MNEHEKAVYKTLLMSVSTGLNANLSSEDSRTLLKMIMKTTELKQLKRRKEHPIDRIVRNVSTVFSNTLEELADDIEEIGEVSLRERRRKR